MAEKMNFRKRCIHCGRNILHNQSPQIDDNVRHIFREHNQDADHVGNLGAAGRKKIIVINTRTKQKTGRRCEPSGTAAPRLTEEVVVVL